MKIWSAISSAFLGWLLIIKGDTGWREHFTISLAGFATALVVFLFFGFLAIAAASTYQGMPGVLGILDALLAQCLWIAAILISIRVTAAILKSKTKTFELLIPAIYLMVAYLLVGSVLNLLLPLAVLLVSVALLYPFYRLGRVAGGWPWANAAAFAVLTVVLLVGLPWALYMLSSTAAPLA